MSQIIYLNGEYINRDDGKISIMDRGFLFGDGVYELVPIYKSKPFLINKHLQRLRSSLELVGMKTDFAIIEDLESIMLELIAKNKYVDHFFYVHITRGCQSSRNHVYPDGIKPTVLVMGEEYKVFSKEKLKNGFKGCVREDFRWMKSNIKSISLLGNVLLKNYAAQNGFYETLLIRNKKLTEGSASNIFVVNSGKVMTPNLGVEILPGITRDLLIELFRKNNIDVEETDVSEDDLLNSEEVWCTSSTNYCVPITEIDSKKIGDGTVGEYSYKSYDLINNFISEL